MKRSTFAAVAAAGGAAALGVTAAKMVDAQSPAPYPSWTGAGYGFAQHLAIMQQNMDQAAVAMARSAEQSAKNETVKRLAADVVAARTKELESARDAYRKQYGTAPPAWPGTQSGPGPGRGYYGPGMMGGGYGPGVMRGAYGPGGGWAGPMMAYGDGWQGMMGWRGGWWQGSDADRGFPAALVRLDAMQISMATLALQGGDAALRERARAIVAARTDEISRAGALLK